jgi:Glyoxalase-like domain
VRIDHVIWVADDLHPAADRLALEHGLPEGGGGRHARIGTHNRVFPLGGAYLEVIAVADQEEAAASALGRAIARAPAGLLTWAVAVDDVLDRADRLGLELTTVERDGLTARVAGLAEAMAEPWLPFFIQRDPGVEDPGAGGDAGGIAWIELVGDPERLRAWLGGEELPVRYATGDVPGVRAVGLGSGAVIR